MNRRTFFQAAALSTAAVLQSKGRIAFAQMPGKATVVEADLAEPGAAQYGGSHNIELFVRLEEQFPGDPGQLSGAVLRIIDAGESIYLHASIGNTLQPYGGSTPHWLGSMDTRDVKRLASFDPNGDDCESEAAPFTDPRIQGQPWALWAVLYPGDAPELRLESGGHSFGVLRGELLSRFFNCLRQRVEGTGATH